MFELDELLAFAFELDDCALVLEVVDSVVVPNAREKVLAAPMVPVEAIEEVTSPWRTVLVRYCVVAAADCR